MKSLETAIRAGLKDPKVSQQDSQQNRPEMEKEIEIEGGQWRVKIFFQCDDAGGGLSGVRWKMLQGKRDIQPNLAWRRTKFESHSPPAASFLQLLSVMM